MPVASTTKLLAQLFEDFTPKYAVKWKVIGTLLGICSGTLDAIESEWPTNAVRCCNKMFRIWLKVDTSASLEKAHRVIESPAVSGIQASVNQGADAVSILSKCVAENCIKQQFITDEETWPPNQPTVYVPQNLMYHQYQCNDDRETDLLIPLGGNNTFTSADSNCAHHRHNALNYQPSQLVLSPDNSTKVTKDAADIFAVLGTQEYILIEGASGMGKTMLLKEIFYRWATNQLKETFKLVILICLQDPQVHEKKSLNDLLQYYCEENCFPLKVTENVIACCDQISEQKGENIAFLFDSFEEFSMKSWKKSFVYKLLKRKALPNSALVVASLPHASASLREQATVRACLLGFEMEQKIQFIKQTLDNQTQKFTEVIQYLVDKPTINSICFVPFNLVILLFLYNHGVLSSNLTQLYNYFVTLTICRQLAKHGHSFEHNTFDLTNLPAPCNKIIKQLCKLSLENLKTKQTTIFTLDVIKKRCPDILETPGGITGFGLLHAVQHQRVTGKAITFSFIHHCFQEFLAAHHVHMLDSQLKCIEFFTLFFKAGKTEICRHIANAKIFEGKVISFRGKSLSSSNIEDVACFLNQAPQQEWEEVDLHKTNLQDSGIEILHKGLVGHNITIKALSLSDNNLTESSSSKIFNITVHCRVKRLSIRFNTNIGKDPKLYSIISDPNSVVEELDISSCNQSSTTEFFSALGKITKKKLRLRINNNNIADDACGAIVKALWANTSLVELTMYGNPINVTMALQIVGALAHNNTLQYLVLPYYDTNDREKITELAKKVDKDRYCNIDLFCNKF